MESPALVFIGFMGAGKTTGARAAAAELGVRAIDTDRELEQRIGTSIERSGLVSVGSGFIATRQTSGSPLVMPPSTPPARLVSRKIPRSSE